MLSKLCATLVSTTWLLEESPIGLEANTGQEQTRDKTHLLPGGLDFELFEQPSQVA